MPMPTTTVVLRDFEDYADKALRTVAPAPAINGSYILGDILHAVLGISGEVGEIVRAETMNDQPNEVEEAGDVLWYAPLLARSLIETPFYMVVQEAMTPAIYPLSGKMDDPGTATHTVNSKIMVMASADMVDVIKRAIYYKGAGIDRARLMFNLVWVLRCLNERCEERFGMSLLNLGALNIAKLMMRYGDKYSDVMALNRDLPAETKTFTEGGAA